MNELINLARKLRPIIEFAMTNVDDKTASEAVQLFPKLKRDNSLISAGTRINYNGTVKRAKVDIWDTLENNPDNAPILWENIQYRNGYRLIPEIITTTTSFLLGEMGYWNDILYESLIDNNVYTPEQYPNGWKIV